ncbi:hypothetical protein PoB_006039300 [Plakobranchus ocellatus]|uniref:BESS domain-containing protein n=1 Tax=Plakobranchus ocellatus TaxID=259542 RepID=A0AAV4CPU5_9GAST|nr:hypothetical protein PoB_006039300 [Plakobranchus ocellatus]
MESLDTYSQSSSPTTSMANSPATQPPTVPFKRALKRNATRTTASAMDEEILKTPKKPENEDEMWAKSLIPSLQKLRHLEKLEFRVEVQSLLIRYLRRQDEEQARVSAISRPSQGASNLNYSEQYYQPWMN